MAERGPSGRFGWTAALGMVFALLLGACGFGAPTGSAPGQVVLYGDSLADESANYFALQLAGRIRVRTVTFPGIALCDFYDDIVADALRARPKAVVLEFSGNFWTPCMAGLSREAAAARYGAQAESLTAFLRSRGITVFWVTAPRGKPAEPGAPERGDQFGTAVPYTAPIYRDLVDRWRAADEDVFLVDAGRAVLQPDGGWTDRLPCRPVDVGCTGGTVPVRAPDGAHFCPTGLGPHERPCAGWSSGAWRFAEEMSGAVRGRYGLG